MTVKRLTLFVTGTSSRTSQAIESVRTLCLEETIELLIVDILVSPELAETEKVFATPMLVRTEPPPKRRLVGDLKDRELIKHRLDLSN